LMEQNMPSPLEQFYFMKAQAFAENCGLTRIEKLENNIGVLEISSFGFPAEIAQPYIDATMQLLASSDALIIDCRRNGGGTPDMVQYVCSYFFDKPTHLNSLYWRQSDETVDYITLDKLPVQKMIDVPIFVLTSSYTFSGAEEFAYNLQTQKRATIIGEVTGGGANPGRMFPIINDFGVFIPTGRAINPITKTNWEGVGVKPEIEVESAKAFETALAKAQEAAKLHNETVTKKIKESINELETNTAKAEKLFNENKTSEGSQLIETSLNKALSSNLLDEMAINQMGYEYLQMNKMAMALAIFQFNVKAFPNSANVYDSLAETHMNMGNKALAIENYKKSLELNPKNAHAVEMLQQLKK